MLVGQTKGSTTTPTLGGGGWHPRAGTPSSSSAAPTPTSRTTGSSNPRFLKSASSALNRGPTSPPKFDCLNESIIQHPTGDRSTTNISVNDLDDLDGSFIPTQHHHPPHQHYRGQPPHAVGGRRLTVVPPSNQQPHNNSTLPTELNHRNDLIPLVMSP
ncbi:hypothetical protein H257_17021 [Aphanomyces astaci]|uniref:Uncharacterized protein n=1 Tax=Aphanomyces astaci TaxID=112090 RepID=W4FIF6_APHAT|nr:hypothetical protein H257_17021 [Aphanomyces astaci]ETV66591.1 hypothetical protein H257_17021 [Aphanomyces astaci]|eukprot:XP_009843962.1 hypothetical protein H257_17021 [Aphanomyces astaci]